MRILTYIKVFKFSDKVKYLAGKLLESIIDKILSYRKWKYQQVVLTQSESLGGTISNVNGYYLIEANGFCFHLRNGSSDFNVYDQIFLKKEYKTVIEFWSQNVETDCRLILDVGANVGFSSMYFAEHFPNAKIIAFEPDLENFKMLSKNVNSINNCLFENKAIWSYQTTLAIADTFRDGESWSHSVTENLNVPYLYKIEATDLNSIINAYNINSIDLLKIDIEGAEGEVFSERGNLDFLNIVKILALEIHDEVCDREYILTVLKRHDFILFENDEITLAVKRSLIK